MAIIPFSRSFPNRWGWSNMMDLVDDAWPDLSSQDGLDIYETEDSVVVEAMVPGVPADKVFVTVEGNVLTIKAECEDTEEKKEKKKVVYRSSCRRSFHYSTSLPRAVDGESAQAEINDGMVIVTIPRKKEDMPKRVEVKAKSK